MKTWGIKGRVLPLRPPSSLLVLVNAGVCPHEYSEVLEIVDVQGLKYLCQDCLTGLAIYVMADEIIQRRNDHERRGV